MFGSPLPEGGMVNPRLELGVLFRELMFDGTGVASAPWACPGSSTGVSEGAGSVVV